MTNKQIAEELTTEELKERIEESQRCSIFYAEQALIFYRELISRKKEDEK